MASPGTRRPYYSQATATKLTQPTQLDPFARLALPYTSDRYPHPHPERCCPPTPNLALAQPALPSLPLPQAKQLSPLPLTNLIACQYCWLDSWFPPVRQTRLFNAKELLPFARRYRQARHPSSPTALPPYSNTNSPICASLSPPHQRGIESFSLRRPMPWSKFMVLTSAG